ncbi:tetratricopeptide repeat protein [Azospirillum canadense]|uniref:tetratricopeptide repeat protein n=1 Tax=Azospirillum canadense TaxID=403962 RepID=UPI002227101D|nr:tetratricopeptide repeat protein [Azospirillum canadense]MCW2236293.1 Flp pilus assembly protein TadD [Azospirillum canadense]
MNAVVEFLRAGVQALQRSEPALACDRLARALALAPDHGEAWNILGVLAISAGDAAAAEPRFRRAAACAPANPAYARSLAECLKRQNRPAEARHLLAQAARRGALSADLACDLADLTLTLSGPTAALPLYRLALTLAPDHARALNNRAETLSKAGQRDEAADAFARLATLRGTAPAWLAAGSALLEAWRQDEARPALRRAAVLDPAAAGVWANLGFAALGRHLGRHAVEDAATAFVRALRLAPDLAEARAGQGTLLMLTGRLREGAAAYEARLTLPHFAPPRRFDRPAWDGVVRPGQTLLVHADRGIGDAIQFIRYTPLLRARGMRVLFHGQFPLFELFRASGVVDGVSDHDGPLPEHDAQIHVMSLMHRMGTDLDSVPATVPYLRAPEAAARRWADRLADVPGLRVGLVWSGSTALPYHRQRSPGLEPLLPLTTIPGVTPIALQVGPGRADLDRVSPPGALLDLGAEIRDYADTAAILQALDMVVSVDTSVTHLAGALGRPVAVLLDQGAEWRWLRHRPDTPWYPTARLYRQSSFGDWSDPVERLRGDLAAIVEEGRVRRP